MIMMAPTLEEWCKESNDLIDIACLDSSFPTVEGDTILLGLVIIKGQQSQPTSAFLTIDHKSCHLLRTYMHQESWQVLAEEETEALKSQCLI